MAQWYKMLNWQAVHWGSNSRTKWWYVLRCMSKIVQTAEQSDGMYYGACQRLYKQQNKVMVCTTVHVKDCTNSRTKWWYVLRCMSKIVQTAEQSDGMYYGACQRSMLLTKERSLWCDNTATNKGWQAVNETRLSFWLSGPDVTLTMSLKTVTFNETDRLTEVAAQN